MNGAASDPAAGAQRLALVTGAAGAIGSGLVRMLAARGYRVIGVDVAADRLEETLAPVAGIPVVVDATDAGAVEALSERIRGEWAGRLEVLIANAGIIRPDMLADQPASAIRAQLDVMLAAPLQWISAAVPGMVARGSGHLMATVSMGGILPLPGSAPYSAAKAGLRAALMALAAELRGTGVAVSGIYPSGVDTPMLRLEARHEHGSRLNWLGKVFGVDDVVRAYERALDTGRLEVYLPYSDSVSTRLAMGWPWLANRLIPVMERAAARGHANYLARIDAEEGRAG